MFDFVSNAAHWFSSPQVAPWAGAIAAVIAALTVDTKPWVKTPRKGGMRALRVLGVWLVIAGLFGIATGGPGGNRQGGNEGPSPGTTANSPAEAKPDPAKDSQAVESPEKIDGGAAEKFPISAADVVLVVRFLPTPGDEAEALDLSCDLTFRLPNGARTARIRAADMREFEATFANELRAFALPGDPDEFVVSVRRRPFPGDGTLRKIEDLIHAAWPKIAVKFEE